MAGLVQMGKGMCQVGQGISQSLQGLGDTAHCLNTLVQRTVVEPYHTISDALHGRLPHSSLSGKQITVNRPTEMDMRILHMIANGVVDANKPSKEDLIGYIPGFGTIWGTIRICKALFVCGLALLAKIATWCVAKETAATIATYIPSREIFLDSLSDLGRGLIELIPFVGGGALYFYDKRRLRILYEKTMATQARRMGIENFR